jgi:ubiquinone/menaquinone biosynthesis C-methylase UbiE
MEMRANPDVEAFYGGSTDLIGRIRDALRTAGKDLAKLTTADLATFDEFHIRGRQATLELAERMELTREFRVLDIGSGIGGPARTLTEACACTVIGLDLTRTYCAAATSISRWVGLSGRVRFVCGDAIYLPFRSRSFDAVMTIHATMNVSDKRAVYAGAKRVLKPGRIFALYDVLQGEGGPILFPVPWARESSASHLATPAEMRSLLERVGFQIEDEIDSTDESFAWFQEVAGRVEKAGSPSLSPQALIGADWPQMASNQVQNLAERRARTVTYICRAPS